MDNLLIIVGLDYRHCDYFAHRLLRTQLLKKPPTVFSCAFFDINKFIGLLRVSKRIVVLLDGFDISLKTHEYTELMKCISYRQLKNIRISDRIDLKEFERLVSESNLHN